MNVYTYIYIYIYTHIMFLICLSTSHDLVGYLYREPPSLSLSANTPMPMPTPACTIYLCHDVCNYTFCMSSACLPLHSSLYAALRARSCITLMLRFRCHSGVDLCCPALRDAVCVCMYIYIYIYTYMYTH